MLNFKNFIRDLFNEHCTIPTSNLAYCLCLCFQTELGNKDQVTMCQHFGLSWHANKRKNVKPCVLKQSCQHVLYIQGWEFVLWLFERIARFM